MKTIHYLYISIFSFLCFFFITIFIINGNQIFFDEPIRAWISSINATSFFKIITNFGNAYYLLIMILLLFLIFFKKTNSKFLVAMMILNTGGNLLLKNFFARPRPNYIRLITETGYSFPSGHAMASLMFYGLLIYFVNQSRLPKIWKIISTILLIILILLIGISRIYLGVHYASDILGGYLASLFLLSFGIFFFQTTTQKTANK